MSQQYFGQISPSLTTRFEICFKSFFESIPAQKTVSDVLKSGIFLILHFGRLANGGH